MGEMASKTGVLPLKTQVLFMAYIAILRPETACHSHDVLALPLLSVNQKDRNHQAHLKRGSLMLLSEDYDE